MVGGWRKLQNKGLHNFYSSSHNIGMIVSRKIMQVGHIYGRDLYPVARVIKPQDKTLVSNN
jgi:hypothetical protein